MKKNAGHWMRRVHWTRLAGAGVLLAMILLRIADPAPLERLRLGTFDLFQQSHPRVYTDAPVTIIDIDDASLAELGQWPWPRTRVADLVDAATAAGSVALAFDIVFSEPDRLSPAWIASDNRALPAVVREALASLPDNDSALAQAFERSRVIAGQASLRLEEGVAGPTALEPVPHALIGPDPRPWLQTYPRAVRNLEILETAAAGQGFFSVRPDSDGVYRRIPVALVVGEQFRLGLAPELLRVATGGAPFAIRTNEAGIEGVVLAQQMVPTDRDGTLWPWLTPPEPTRSLSAADVLEDRVPDGRLAGQLVLIGSSAIGLEDFRPTALGIPMSGVEIHAQVLENILTNSMLLRPNHAIGAELALGTALGLVIILAAPLIPALWLVIGAVGVLATVGGASYAAFLRERLLLDPSWPMLTALCLLMLMAGGNYLREERRRQRIRAAFGQYVSPELVSRLTDTDTPLRLGGETRELTLLFSDMRGFTAVSEEFRNDPQGLTALMNKLLTTLSEPILSEGGTIDKFLGDAVMAFWNAPLDHSSHAAAACRAALAMREGVTQLNLARAEIGSAPPLRVGIGLNTGPCVVGNMGTPARFDYTAMGDAVNLASRLEAQSKAYAVDIILGDKTHAAVAGRFATVELDLIRVEGKSAPERIHALLGDAEFARTQAFRAVQTAITLFLGVYRAQDWGAALSALPEIKDTAADAGLSLDGLVALFRDRIIHLAAAPPGPDWDGAYPPLDP
ncbi:CHASE2 domain-containing protein [Tropicimonas sp. S265A]|uniref:CHASE2 domain-containing protein n=1 Tax=Tropicimonas sp. S265A TaxID=3415134 RepID=UPI003C7BE2EF